MATHPNTSESNFKISFLTILLLLCFIVPVSAQVSEVKKLATSNKAGLSDFGESDVAAFIFIEFFDDFLWLFSRGQKEALQRRHEEPWLVSLEAGIHGGYYSKETALVTMPSFRANWGLFSSHVRWDRMQDFTGSFRTFDWQVFQLYLVNQPSVGFRMGGGFSQEMDIDQTFPEYTVALELHFKERKINPLFEIRWSQDYDTGQTPRFEFNSRLDYRIASAGKFNVNLSGGLLYQRYYSTIDFYFLQTGINITFY